MPLSASSALSSLFLLRLARLGRRLQNCTGWRRYLLAMALGFVGALAYAPVGFFPIFWISFPGVVLLLQGSQTRRAAFAVGWSFAFGNFVLGLYWIADSLFVDIKEFWWAVPFSVAGLPAFLAIYYGIAAVISRRVGLRGASGAVFFAIVWVIADYLRGHLLGGFPWNLEGSAWVYVLPMLQSMSVIGIYGLTLITIAAACLPACLVENSRFNARAVGIALLIVVAIELVGVWRLMDAPPVANETTETRLRIVQPNVAQAQKWLPSEQENHFQKLLDMSSAPGVLGLNLVIWPETASPFYLDEDGIHRQAIVSRLPSNVTVITGVIRHEIIGDNKAKFYNSLAVVDHHADIAATYDKFHLVPFGEFIPYRAYLPIHSLVSVGVNFSAGDGPHTLHVDGVPSFSPFICYEAVFPGSVVDPKDRPHFLLNVTNDGWYGNTAGPYQHFAAARARAIEEGLPLLRAANTGISGVVDAYGRVTAELGVGQSGILDTNLPIALPPTLFSRWGDWILGLMLAVFVFGGLLLRKYEPSTSIAAKVEPFLAP